MSNTLTPAALIAVAAMTLAINIQSAAARESGGGGALASRVEMQREPNGYTRLDRPNGVDSRPATIDRSHFNRNYAAERTFHIGPYHGPAGWHYARCHYGQFLPAIFWAQQYWLSDYWLFALDVPPIGYEWVRYGNDVLLVNVTTGEIVESVYDLFV